MRSLLVLSKLSFRTLMNTFKVGRKKAGNGYAALLFLVGICVYISSIYSATMASALVTFNALSYLLPIMAMYAGCLCLMYTMYASKGIIFGGTDNDFMLSLPVSAFKVMLARILALYAEDFVITLAMLIPACVVFVMNGGALTVSFILVALLGCLFLPLVAVLLALLVGFLTALLTTKLPFGKAIEMVMYLLTFVLFFIVTMRLNGIYTMMESDIVGFAHTFNTYLYPYGLFHAALQGRYSAIPMLMLITLVPFLVITYLCSMRYKKILTLLTSHRARTDYKLTTLHRAGQFHALVIKEVKRFLGTPIFLFNMGLGILVLIGGSIYALFRSNDLIVIAGAFGQDAIAPILCAVVCFFASTIAPACVSISLEGQYIWILKEAPVDVRTLFRAKICQNLILAWPPIIISVILLSIALHLPMVQMLTCLVLCLCVSLMLYVFGLCVNMLFPKMDAINETIVVKQSMSSFLGIVGGMVIVGLLGALYVFTLSFLSFTPFALLACAACLLVSFLLWQWLCHSGVRRFAAL